LVELDLKYNNIGNEGARHIAEALKTNNVNSANNFDLHELNSMTMYRHSLCSIFQEIKLQIKEYNI